MRILALDTGTITGWAYKDADHSIKSGTWDLTPHSGQRPGERLRTFYLNLREFDKSVPIDLIVYEEQHGHSGTAAAHLYGAFIGIIQLYSELFQVRYAPVGVQMLKKFATGRGNASKEEMIAAAQKRFHPQHIEDDNHADALHLLDYAIKNFVSPS
ncbi:MAG: hypothetical protein AMXMBFR7_45590 [Planctomycetota bacterium]